MKTKKIKRGDLVRSVGGTNAYRVKRTYLAGLMPMMVLDDRGQELVVCQRSPLWERYDPKAERRKRQQTNRKAAERPAGGPAGIGRNANQAFADRVLDGRLTV